MTTQSQVYARRAGPRTKKTVAWALPFLVVVICPICRHTVYGPTWHWNNEDISEMAAKKLANHFAEEDNTGGHVFCYAYAREDVKQVKATQVISDLAAAIAEYGDQLEVAYDQGRGEGAVEIERIDVVRVQARPASRPRYTAVLKG